MSNLQINFFSNAIMRFTTFHMYLPNDVFPLMTQGNPHYERPAKTMVLLHGFSGSSYDFVNGSLASELALKYNLAVVMPSGDNSFYLNAKATGNNYETLIAEDLIMYLRKTFQLAMAPEDTFIGGISMGGFGSLHTGLKYADRFGRIFALSSALIVNDIVGMQPGDQNEIANYQYYANVFGELDRLKENDNDPEYVVKERTKRKEKIQPVFMACGTEDFLIEQNRSFYEFLKQYNVDVTYRESAGMHDWQFWNAYMEPAVEWAIGITK